MKIAMVILGTRGDVQPMVALARGLMKNGHEVVVCAPPENEELVKRYNCPFIAFGPGIKKAVRENPGKQKGGVAIQFSPKEGKKFTMDQMSLLPEMLRGSDLVLGAGIVIGVHTAADALKVPYRLVIHLTPDPHCLQPKDFRTGIGGQKLEIRGPVLNFEITDSGIRRNF